MYSAFGASSTRNAPLTSKLTEEQREQLCGLLGNVELSLLYKASVHGYQASAFHQRCDRQGPTLLVAYNRSGYTFGGYTSVDYSQSMQNITDEEAFLFSFHGGARLCIDVNSGHYARYDDVGGPNFGQQLYFCYNNQPHVYNQGAPLFIGARGNAFESTLLEPQVSAEKPWRNVLWTAEQRAELMEIIRKYKPLVTSVSRVRILMIGPVGAGKSSFFNSINSIFMGRMTSKAMSGSAGTSLTTQFRTYPVKDGRGGKPLPFVLCDTMGLEEQSGAGLDIEDISSILQGHVPDRYKVRALISKMNEG
uniref:TLDc domain-containing protein n=1 Tax=Sinocyclocheilus anshuiensis TaxID=1608454 RepID=A0A671P3Z2_9TELE